MIEQGKTALVTGGGSGIGYAVAKEFIEAGCTVCVLDISEELVNRLNDEFDERLRAVRGDVTSIADNERAVQMCVDEFGGLDVFVGNAGIFDNFRSLGEIDTSDLPTAFDELFHIDVMGYMLGVRAALPELIENDGNVVFTASFSSMYPAGGGILYTAAKHAVAGIIKQLAHELAPEVRVNGVAPGYVPTQLAGLDSLGQSSEHASSEDMRDIHPLGTVPEPETYAGYYLFLASEASRATTGEIITADCGISIRGI